MATHLENHIHWLNPANPYATYCSCPHCGLIADHHLVSTRLTLIDFYTRIERRCLDCGSCWTMLHVTAWRWGEPCP